MKKNIIFVTPLLLPIGMLYGNDSKAEQYKNLSLEIIKQYSDTPSEDNAIHLGITNYNVMIFLQENKQAAPIFKNIQNNLNRLNKEIYNTYGPYFFLKLGTIILELAIQNNTIIPSKVILNEIIGKTIFEKQPYSLRLFAQYNILNKAINMVQARDFNNARSLIAQVNINHKKC